MWLHEGMRLLRRNWLILVACVLIGAALGALFSLTTTPRYRASAQLYVSTVAAGGTTATSDLTQGAAYLEKSVRTFITVIPTAVVLEPVIEELGLDTDVEELAKRIAATPGSGSSIIVVSATDESPEQAARIANAVGAAFERVVAEELEPAYDDSPAPLRVEAVQRAIVPTVPSTPNWVGDIVLGAIVGLIAAFVIVVLRVRFDTRLRTAEDVEQALGAPVLGSVPDDAEVEARPLIVGRSPADPVAEAFRALRTNVQYLPETGRPNIILLSGTGPGEAKSTAAANLAIAFAELGLRVALVDADLREPQQAQLFGLDGSTGLADVLGGHTPLSEVVHRCGEHRLYVVPAGVSPIGPTALLGSPAMGRVATELAAAFDVVIVDTPPVPTVSDAILVGVHARGAILVAAAGVTRSSRLQASANAFALADVPILGAVVTMLSPSRTRPARAAAPTTDADLADATTS